MKHGKGFDVMAKFRRTSFLRLGTLLSVLGFVALGASALNAQASADVRSLLDRAYAQYQEGSYEDSLANFERAFAMNPSNDAILDFVDKASVASILSMMRTRDPRVAGVGRQLLEAARRESMNQSADAEQIEAAVGEVLSAEGQDQLILRLKYAGTFGRNLVPALIPHLANSDLERRAQVITWLPTIGLPSAPALQVATQHGDPTVRANAATLLGVGSLRHATSLAWLKAMVEADDDTAAKGNAQKSLDAVLGDLNGRAAALSAKEYFLGNAYQFYARSHKNPFAKGSYMGKVYAIEDGELVAHDVARFQVSEKMAEQALEQALALDPQYFAAQVLDVCNNAAQVVEYDANVAKADSGSQPEVFAVLESQKNFVDFNLRLRVLAAPSQVLYAGVDRALSDQRTEVAGHLIETIGHTSRGGEVPEALVKALAEPDSRRVRVAAATTIANWNSNGAIEGGDSVIETLSDAVTASGVRTAQRIMGDRRRANRFGAILRELGVETYSPLASTEEGISAILNSPPDMVFLDENMSLSVGKPGEAPINYFVTMLRRNYRSAGVPVVVVVGAGRETNARDLYESEERKVWVVSDSVNPQTLKSVVFDQVFDEADDEKAQATTMAAGAARALLRLSSIRTSLPVSSSVSSLVAVLRDRPDTVRLPSMAALGNLGASEAASALAMVAAQDGNSLEVREAALTALGQVLESSSATSQAVLSVIKEAMQSSELPLRQAAWFASSSAGLTGADRRKALGSGIPAAAMASHDDDEGDEDHDEDDGDGGDGDGEEDSPFDDTDF